MENGNFTVMYEILAQLCDDYVKTRCCPIGTMKMRNRKKMLLLHEVTEDKKKTQLKWW